jgi:hypothetical protein
MTQQIGDPLTILNLRLPPWDCSHVLGIHQNDRVACFQQIEHGSPIDPRTLEGYVADLQGG